ncbi:hypothetical protein V565_159340 [Rhizoctonia solani 123E]|uniref:MYND-type domain-containing protein n=1 Tax=Rhizoctonia solani 123E TaxID=1423351 RepID=A0A074RKK6_9AGAM|nr:hypothetical protein V565_159340 [Rhizoctonia solani 123E]
MASATDSPAIDKYGPTLTIYLNEAGYKHPRELAPSLTVSHIADAVKSLAEPERVTFHTFETLMALEWSPLCNHMELILGDSKVYPLCIKLLRSIYAEDRDILGNAYGFMCLQFITLAMDVAKIAQNDRLTTFQEEVSKLSPGHSVRSIMNNYARELEGEGIWYDIGNVDNFVRYLGWDWGEDRYRSCLPQIGGCGFKDTIFLLQQLGNERELFLQAAQVASGIFPGWGGLVYVIWHTVFENLGELEKPTILAAQFPKERTKLVWSCMFEIGLRYAMCSEIQEDPLVYVTINSQDLRASLARHNTYSAVDDEDAILVATCTTRKLRSLSTINDMNLMAAEILGYASVLLGPTDFQFHAEQLFKAAFCRAWNEISAIHRMDSFRWCTFTIHLDILITSLHLLCEKHGKHPERAKVVRDLALEWDLYELYAYTLLFPLSLHGKSIKATENLPDDLEFEMGLQMLALKQSVIKSDVSLNPTNTFFPIWERIDSHILFHQEVLGNARLSKGLTMTTLWSGATRIFPYERYISANTAFQCAYARCAAPKAIIAQECGSCYLKVYCSHRCQQADWAYPHNPHMLQCQATKRLEY